MFGADEPQQSLAPSTTAVPPAAPQSNWALWVIIGIAIIGFAYGDAIGKMGDNVGG